MSKEHGWIFPDHLPDAAWGIIANASDWDMPDRTEWRETAEQWRDAYHKSLDAMNAAKTQEIEDLEVVDG